MRILCIDDRPMFVSGFPSGLVKYKEYDGFLCNCINHPEGKHGWVIPEVYCPGCWEPKRFRPIREVDVTAIFKCEELVGADV